MQEVSQLTPELRVRPAPMAAWQRRTVLGMLIVLGTLLNATLEEIALGFESLQLEKLATVLAGVIFAQASLLAVWGGLARQPLPVRIPSALGVAATFGLALVWGNRRGISEEGMLELACLVVLLVLVQALVLLLVRRYWRWQIGVSNDGPGAENTHFGLRTVLLWTAATAALLAIGRWVVPRQDASLGGGYETVMTMLIVLPIATAISLPLVIPSVGLVLGQRRRLGAAAWLALMSVMTFVAFFTFMCLGTWMSGQASSPWETAGDVLRVGLPMHVALITMLLTGLLMLRLCGFRLLHQTNEAAVDINLEKPAAVEQPRARWRFVFSATALLILIAALLWPAWKVEQRWRAYSRLVAAEEEWEGLGMDVTVEGERITSIDSTNHFDPSAPIPPAALREAPSPAIFGHARIALPLRHTHR